MLKAQKVFGVIVSFGLLIFGLSLMSPVVYSWAETAGVMLIFLSGICLGLTFA